MTGQALVLLLHLSSGAEHAAAHAADGASYAAVLQSHAQGGKVDYAALQASRALDAHLTALAAATEPEEPRAKMAFWINAYNALTIDMMADEWPVESIRSLDAGKVWDTRRFTVAGREVTLNDVEHKILRPMGDARVHAAINCASQGCPPLAATPFTAAQLDAELDQASRAWMAANGMRRDGSQVTFNKIFDWYGEDFVKVDDCSIPIDSPKLAAAACFASKHVDADTSAWLRAGGYTAAFHAYSWRPNAR